MRSVDSVRRSTCPCCSSVASDAATRPASSAKVSREPSLPVRAESRLWLKWTITGPASREYRAAGPAVQAGVPRRGRQGERLRILMGSCRLNRPMTRRFPRSLVLSLCALASGAVALAPLWQAAAYVRAEDRNGDGRPDIWRTYDRLGRVSDVTVDTNFDGRSDVHEYYQRGALVRRESDRDFNDRVDLVQEFDPTTREPVRTVVDVDFDGTADLLVLFQGGQPVFSEWAPPVAPAAVGGDRRLTSDASART